MHPARLADKYAVGLPEASDQCYDPRRVSGRGDPPQIVRGAPDHLRVGAGGEAEQEQLADFAQRYARDAARLMQRMPRELLLLLKTNDCLRSVDRELGQVSEPDARFSSASAPRTAAHMTHKGQLTRLLLQCQCHNVSRAVKSDLIMSCWSWASQRMLPQSQFVLTSLDPAPAEALLSHLISQSAAVSVDACVLVEHPGAVCSFVPGYSPPRALCSR